MINPEKKAQIDQDRALLAEVFPSMWREMYLRLLEEGFSEVQSLELVKTYILSYGNVKI